MKKFGLFTFLAVIAICLVSTAAYADTATLTYTGPTGPNNDYPYGFHVKVNGVTTNQTLMCASEFTYIQGGESWTANIFTPLTAPIPGVPASGYSLVSSSAWLAAAWLYDNAKANLGNEAVVLADQRAVWSLFMAPGPDATAQGVLAGLAGNTLTAPNDVLIYMYDGVSSISGQYGSYEPQIFLGSTPEPSGLLLLGTGLSLLAFGLYRGKLLA